MRPFLCISNAAAAEIPSRPWLVLLALHCSRIFVLTGRMQYFLLQKAMWGQGNMFNNLRFRRTTDILEMILSHSLWCKEQINQHIFFNQTDATTSVLHVLNMSVLLLDLAFDHTLAVCTQLGKKKYFHMFQPNSSLASTPNYLKFFCSENLNFAAKTQPEHLKIHHQAYWV